MPFAVLRRLSAEAFRSGELISRELALSRASVHNAVELARTLGVDIHAVRGRGYRLALRYSWLDQAFLEEALKPLGYAVQVEDRLDSTNTQVLAAAQAGAAHKFLLAAEMQMAGRGRRGRNWFSQLGGGLTFSLLWRFNRPLTGLSGLSLAVGLALTRVLRAQGVSDAAVKWPNDVLLGDRKLAGILIETQGDMLSTATAVIGIGVNFRAGLEVQAAAAQPVADLSGRLAAMPDRNRVLIEIARELERVLTVFDAQGFEPFVDDWQAVHAWQGRPVRVINALGESEPGVAMGVDGQGLLLLQTEGGLKSVHSGEVSLRSA